MPAPHDDEPRHPFGESGLQGHRCRDVRERTDRHEGDRLGCRAVGLDQVVDRLGRGGLPRRAGNVQVGSVRVRNRIGLEESLRGHRLAHERPRDAGVHGDLGSADEVEHRLGERELAVALQNVFGLQIVGDVVGGLRSRRLIGGVAGARLRQRVAVGGSSADALEADVAGGTGDVLDDEALIEIGAASRARLSSDARVVAVTGSVGKTGTKEALRLILAKQGATHASVASYNNHFGVPLTLARMDQATKFGIFEIGMNHAGEIAPLTLQVKPHVALITTVEAVHIENFPSVEAIADEKAAIFKGLVEGGTAVINRDNPHYERLWTHASRSPAARVISFGENPAADIRLAGLKDYADGSDILAEINGVRLEYHLGSPGRHLALNSLGVLGVVLALGADVNAASLALADVKPPAGRGSRFQINEGDEAITVIDESYNANPASMRAAFALLKATAVGAYGRRIAILGDMLELGAEAASLHAELSEDLDALEIDLVYACGPLMAELYERLPSSRRGAWYKDSQALAEALPHMIQKGDVLMVKGSNGSRMASIITRLKAMAHERADQETKTMTMVEKDKA